jgi:hypothetical protein
MASGTDTDIDVMESDVLTPIMSTEIAVMVSTAKRYPRDVTTFKKKALNLAISDPETAQSCIYALPRKEKNGQIKKIKGPSIRLAEILASSYGHLWCDGRQVADEGDYVKCRGTAFDVENNVMIGVENKRRITDRTGRRFSEDMVGVTANACISIALRNAILHVIPKTFWQPIYDATVKAAVGDQKTLSERRAKALEYFQKLGISNKQIFERLNVANVESIGLDQLEDLFGLASAIRDGDASIDDVFKDDAVTPEATPAEPKILMVSDVLAAAKEVGWTSKQAIEFIKNDPSFKKDLTTLEKGDECVRAIAAIKAASGTKSESGTKSDLLG